MLRFTSNVVVFLGIWRREPSSNVFMQFVACEVLVFLVHGVLAPHADLLVRGSGFGPGSERFCPGSGPPLALNRAEPRSGSGKFRTKPQQHFSADTPIEYYTITPT